MTLSTSLLSSVKQMRRAVLLLLFCSLLSACSSAQQSATPTPLTPVTVQLAWIVSAEYAPLYVAKEKGYYQAEQLNPSFVPLDQTDPVTAVLSGTAQFGITSADRILDARANNKPIVGISTIYQRSPVAFISLSERGITKPQDLIGKKVLIDTNGTIGLIYTAFLKSQSISAEQVQTITRTDFSNAQLLNGEVDIMDAYINDQPIQLAREGHKTNAILASDYGIDVYPNVIFTSEALLQQQPELVEKFIRATLRGMQATLERPDEAAAITVAAGQDLKLEIESEAMQRALPMLKPMGSQPGLMTAASWKSTALMMEQQQLLKNIHNVTSAYDLSFVEKAYAP